VLACQFWASLATYVTYAFFEAGLQYQQATKTMIIADTSASGFRPATGRGYDGVVSLRAGGNLGTGALLYYGRALPTAAHVVVGLPFEMLGYGATGSGLTGEQANTAGSLHKAVNSFDTSSAGLWPLLSSKPSWLPSQGSQLVADFDNGLALNDTLGRITASPNLGLGPSEGLLGPGDSGSPAFIDGLLAGIGSHTSASLGPQNGDIDEEANSSFGELAFWQRVGYYQSFIDQSLRGEWSGAPTTPEQVATVVTEGNGAPTLAYFLVELSGLVDFESQSYSVDYATRDGTAKAGDDYVAQQGTLVFYPGDTAVAIAIEIISDWRAEPTETFYLDIFNPVGGSFLGDQAQLTAMRTILDNDWV